MKFKKIIAMLLTLSMVLAMGSFTASADNASVPSDVVLFSYADGTLTGVAGVLGDFNVKASGNLTYTKIKADESAGNFKTGTEPMGDGVNEYAITNYTRMVCNFNNTGAYFCSADNTGNLYPTIMGPGETSSNKTKNSVFSFKYDIRIPEGSPDAESRWLEMQIGSGYNKTASSSASLVSSNKLFVKVVNGKIKATVGTSATFSKYELVNDSKGIDYNKGEWYTVEFRVAIVENKQVWAVYVTDSNDNTTQIMYAETANAYSSIALGQFIFNEDKPESAPLVTHYDNMACLARDASYTPVYEVPEEPAVDYQALVNADVEGIQLPSSPIAGGTVLPVAGTNGSTITWASSPVGIISSNGKIDNLDLSENTEVTLTATATLEGATATKAFACTIAKEASKDFIKFTFENLADDYEGLFFTEKTTDSGVSYTTNSIATNEGVDLYSDVFKASVNTADGFKATATASSEYEGFVNKQGKSLWASTNKKADGVLCLISDARFNMSPYISDVNETVLVSNYDIYIPEGTEASKRVCYVQYHVGGAGNTFNFSPYAEITNGKVIFSLTNNTDTMTIVPLTATNVSAHAPSNEWINIQHIMKIKPDASGNHSVKLYGIVDGVCYYEAELTLPTLTIGLYRMDFRIAANSTEAENIVTGYDNIYTSKIIGDTDDFVKPAAIYGIECDETNNTITTASRVPNTSGSYCLVLAVYDANGRLQTIKPGTLNNEGRMEVVLNNASEYFKNNYKYKAFIFDSLSTLIPQATMKEITYSAN